MKTKSRGEDLASGAAFQLRQDLLHSLVRGSGAEIRKAHRDGLVWIDGDGVEDNFASAALHIEHVQQIFNANIMGGQRRADNRARTAGSCG